MYPFTFFNIYLFCVCIHVFVYVCMFLYMCHVEVRSQLVKVGSISTMWVVVVELGLSGLGTITFPCLSLLGNPNCLFFSDSVCIFLNSSHYASWDNFKLAVSWPWLVWNSQPPSLNPPRVRIAGMCHYAWLYAFPLTKLHC